MESKFERFSHVAHLLAGREEKLVYLRLKHEGAYSLYMYGKGNEGAAGRWEFI